MRQETVADCVMPARKVSDRYLANVRTVQYTPYKQLPENDDAHTAEITAEEDRQDHSVDVAAEEVVVHQIPVSTINEAFEASNLKRIKSKDGLGAATTIDDGST